MKLASFDIEICDELENGTFDLAKPPRIACAALAIQAEDEEPKVEFFQSQPDRPDMTGADVYRMWSRMCELVYDGYAILTWNGVAFDLPLVGAFLPLEYVRELHSISFDRHVDMMLLVSFQTGYRLGLDAALKGAMLETKLHHVTLKDGTEITDMSGAKAPELWRAGERQAVLDYLRVDVLAPLKLARHIEQTQRIRWTSKKGYPMGVSSPLLTVADAYRQLPVPWMSAPIDRVEYIQKHLGDVA